MADTVKEFLIGLGFKVDDASYKKYVASVAAATERATQLGAAVITTATAIGVHVERVAREFENFAYIAQRTGVQAVGAYALAGRQIGLTSDQAIGSIESLAAVMRTQPGIQGLLGQFGVGPGNAKNQLFQFVDALKARFGEANYFVAAKFAQMAGIEEQTFRQMWTNLRQLKEADRDANERLKAAGINATDANAAFLKYAQLLNLLGDNFGILGTRIAMDFLPWSEKAVKNINSAVEGFNEYNAQRGGGPGMIGTILGAGFAGQFATNVLAKIGLPGAGAASSIMPFLAKWGLLSAVPLVAMTREASGSERDIYRKNAAGKNELTEYGKQVIGAEKGTRASPLLDEQAIATFVSLKSSTDKLNDILSSNRIGEPNWLKSGLVNVDIPSVSPGKKFYTDEERKKDMRLSYIDDPPPLATKAWPAATGSSSQSVTIDARTTINFQGGATPEATASLQRGLEAHAANIVRNLKAVTVPGNGVRP